MWEIRDYNENYFYKMIDMTAEYYGEDNEISNPDFIKHEYFDNPFGSPIISLAWTKKMKF